MAQPVSDPGLDGLQDTPRSGRPRTYDADKVKQVIHRALHDKPKATTNWSVRTMAEAEGISSTTVHRAGSRTPGVSPPPRREA